MAPALGELDVESQLWFQQKMRPISDEGHRDLIQPGLIYLLFPILAILITQK